MAFFFLFFYMYSFSDKVFIYYLPFVAGSYLATRFEYITDIERYLRNGNGGKVAQSIYVQDLPKEPS